MKRLASRGRHRVLLVWFLVGCGLPRDADGTLDRARGGLVRVGVAHNPPWVNVTASGAQGVEVTLVQDIARELEARIEWVPGAESELLSALEQRHIDLVLGGLTDDLPWKTKVAFTRPFYDDPQTGKKHVMATSPGENAWLVHLERELRRRRDTIPMLVRATE